MSKFKKLYLEVQDRLSKLEIKFEQLALENLTLLSDNTSLKTEVIALKDRLGLNSTNSSIPSSKEMYKIKKNTPSTGRKIGAQVGHKGNFRDQMIADEIVKIDLEQAKCECGGEIGILNNSRVEQRIEILEIKPYVTEYYMQKG